MQSFIDTCSDTSDQDESARHHDDHQHQFDSLTDLINNRSYLINNNIELDDGERGEVINQITNHRFLPGLEIETSQ